MLNPKPNLSLFQLVAGGDPPNSDDVPALFLVLEERGGPAE
jgi:hypothetical protein